MPILRLLRPLLGLALLLAGCVSGPRPAPALTDAPSLIRAMHAQHTGRWYRTLAFTQESTTFAPDGTTRTEIWREWLETPGRLRIEIGPAADGRGALFVGDSTFLIQDGQIAGRRAERNPLLLLGFDVVGQPPPRTLALLEAEGFPLVPFREATWQGRPAYVFGDSTRKEVWVDRERLVFVRLVETAPAPAGGLTDIRFDDYREEGGGWIAPIVEVYSDGRLVFREVYRDVRTNLALDPGLFDPAQWAAAGARQDLLEGR